MCYRDVMSYVIEGIFKGVRSPTMNMKWDHVYFLPGLLPMD